MTASQPALATDVQFASAARELPAEPELARWAEAAFFAGRETDSAASVVAAELCIRIVDDTEGQALNRAYRERDYATNVLSFPAELTVEQQMLLGDIVLCAGVVEREALEQGKHLRDHYAHLVVHGVLHLLGFDHQDELSAQDMESREIAILEGLGIANPYLFADTAADAAAASSEVAKPTEASKSRDE